MTFAVWKTALPPDSMSLKRISTGQAYTSIGAMVSQINILKRNNRRDANGEFLDPVVVAGPLWARVQYMTDKLSQLPQQVVTEATHKVIIRYAPGIDSGMMVQTIGDGKIFNMTTSPIDPDDRKVELWLFCYERTDGKK